MGSLPGFIQSLALILGLDWEQGLNAFALHVLTEEGWLPQLLCCPISAAPLVEVSTCESGQGAEGRAGAAAAAVGVLWLQAAGGAGHHVLFPHGPALSSCQKEE